MRNFVALILYLSTGIQAIGQYTFISLYDLAPLALNPALVAAKKDMNAYIHYRSEHLGNTARLTKSQAGFILPIQNKKSQLGGLGMHIYNTQINTQPSAQYQGLILTFGHGITLSQCHKLCIGMQTSVQQQRISNENITTGSQWSTASGYDAGTPSNETLTRQITRNSSVTLGIYWQYKKVSLQKSYAGISYSLPVVAKHTAFSYYNSFYSYLQCMVGWNSIRVAKWYIGPIIYAYSYHGFKYANAGANVTIPIKNTPRNDNNFQARIVCSSQKILTLSGLYESDHYTCSIGYDILMGNTKQFAPQQAFEIAFSYRTPLYLLKNNKKYNIYYSKKQHKKVPLRYFSSIPNYVEALKIPVVDTILLQQLKTTQVKYHTTQKNITLYYSKNQYIPDQKYDKLIKTIIDTLRNTPKPVYITGYADASGSFKYNHYLSTMRAQYIRNLFLIHGIPSHFIKSVGKGILSENNNNVQRKVQIYY